MKYNNWPEPTSESRPWTRWWWLGSAVDRPNLTRLLKIYHEAGLGGVEITSIYAVKGMEKRNIPYLSDEWLAMVRHTIAEAGKLGMKVDLPPGCGWRIGGPFITDDVASAKLAVEPDPSGNGYRCEIKPSGEPVKRPGPGGAGKAFNPFSRKSLEAAIRHFTPHFKDLGIRAQFHDSWEYESDACPELFNAFKAKRGYDLRDHLPGLAGRGDADASARLWYHLRLTLAELALENFILPWTEWCHGMGQLSRNQAHGSPANVLDLYAAADIPETEVFRSVVPDTPLLSKFASSAGHVAGRRLISSETGTWLKEHFNVALGDLKMLMDTLFTAGINHHVYHGTAYSPDDAAWPGWLFYASTQLNPQNTIWRDLRALNDYVTRCQSILQYGAPDNDLLVYFPYHDVLRDSAKAFRTYMNLDAGWPADNAATVRRLWKRGYSFDYVSDRQLAEIKVVDGKLVAPGGSYRAVVVPPCRTMPAETLETLNSFSRRGAQVIKLVSDIESALGGLGIGRETMADHPGLILIRRRWSSGHHYFVANQGSTSLDIWVKLAVGFKSVLLMDPLSGRTGKARLNQNSEVRLQLEPGDSMILRTFDTEEVQVSGWAYRTIQGHVLEGEWQVEFIEGGPELPPSYKTSQLTSWTERGGEAERFAGTAAYRLVFDAPAGAGEWLLDLGQVHASARVRLNGMEVQTLIGPSFTTRLPKLKQTDNLLEVEVTNLAANRIRDLDQRKVDWKCFEDINFVNREYKPFDASAWPVTASGLLGPVRLIALE